MGTYLALPELRSSSIGPSYPSLPDSRSQTSVGSSTYFERIEIDTEQITGHTLNPPWRKSSRSSTPSPPKAPHAPPQRPQAHTRRDSAPHGPPAGRPRPQRQNPRPTQQGQGFVPATYGGARRTRTGDQPLARGRGDEEAEPVPLDEFADVVHMQRSVPLQDQRRPPGLVARQPVKGEDRGRHRQVERVGGSHARLVAAADDDDAVAVAESSCIPRRS
jgi:hypothetical protein